MSKIFDFNFFAPNFLKIKTKVNGKQPFVLRKYQRRFIDFWGKIKGPERIVVVKPRQAGFSTLVAAVLFWRMYVKSGYKVIGMADKGARTAAIRQLYSHYLNNLPLEMMPMIGKDNTEQITLENLNMKTRKENPGLSSSIQFETANDPEAGRSEPRMAAHLSEAAFYRYFVQIDEGVQNSIPLADMTAVIKESTANGKAGIGRPFYLLYEAAKRGESIYKPFFVPWYEVDDYAILPPRGFKLTKYEKDCMKLVPELTIPNLMWRRLKVSEYLNDEEESYLTPWERFKQDFPMTDDEAFRSTGQPVFDPDIVNPLIMVLSKNKILDVKDRLGIQSLMLRNYWEGLRIYAPPRDGKMYFIGADVAEGLAQGDASSVYVMDEGYTQVARWHGKIPPDLFGFFLIALGELYNTAFVVPENNNMGHTTVTTLVNKGYPRIFKRYVTDKVTNERVTKYGWTTTGPSKNDMINEGIARLRDGDSRILDISLPTQMGTVTRGENGVVELNSKDRVVAYCLACMGRKDYSSLVEVQSKKNEKKVANVERGTYQDEHDDFMRKNKRKKSGDPFD